MDHLTASLLDLLQKLRERKIPIIVGGGFGLYLKRRHLEATGQRTLFDRLPEPRSTNDLDLFLHGEVLVDFARATQFKETITDDRRLRGEQEKERQHALDLYTIVGMMTEDEYERTKQLGAEIRSNVHAVRARSIVQNQFAGKTTGGVLRLREHPLFRDDFQLNEFIDVLAEIFPGA